MTIANRYEFIFYVECINGNPNGDPDMGNTPRIDPQDMHGFISDVAVKRRIRNYIQTAYEGQAGMDIIMQCGTNLNRKIAECKESVCDDVTSVSKSDVSKGRAVACARFFDVRTFGAVLSTGPNAGQVRGPVQITFGKSVDPILPLDLSITRMCVTDKAGNAKTSADFKAWEEKQPEDKLRTMGRKQLIPYGLYEVRGFISANLAKETGFGEDDLRALFEAILCMYEHDRSASKGQMSVIEPLIIFKHTGTDSSAEGRARQALLGCAPAHRLFELVRVKKKPNVETARSYRDYDAKVMLSKVPAGVEIGFLDKPVGEISWGALPKEDCWLKNE